jgi:hypothetical protein
MISSRYVASLMLAIASLSIGFAAYTPALACHCVTPPGLQGPNTATLGPNQKITLAYTFSYASFPAGPSTITIHITNPSNGWAWVVSPSQFVVTSKNESGTITFFVTVTAPNTPNSNTQFTLSETSSASGFSPCSPYMVKLTTTSGSVGVPEFPMPMAFIGVLGFVLVMAQRRFISNRIK